MSSTKSQQAGAIEELDIEQIDFWKSRGLPDPEERLQLVDRLSSAKEDSSGAIEAWADGLIFELEGRTELAKNPEDLRQRIQASADALDEAYAAGRAFLTRTCGREDADREDMGFEPLGHDEIREMEREAREEIGDVIRKHVCRLPMRSAWRPKLIEMASIDHEFRVAAYEAKVAEIEGGGGA